MTPHRSEGFVRMPDAEFEGWRTDKANPRVHATTRRVVVDAFAEERSLLQPLPMLPYNAVLRARSEVSNRSRGYSLCAAALPLRL